MPKRPELVANEVAGDDLVRRVQANKKAMPAFEAMKAAAWALYNETEGNDAAALLRLMADGLDAMSIAPRRNHRPKGSTQYSETLLRDEMELAERQPLPPGSRLGRDRWLASKLFRRQANLPGEYGGTENGIYARILAIRKKDARAVLRASQELGAEKADALGDLAAFLFRDWDWDVTPGNEV